MSQQNIPHYFKRLHLNLGIDKQDIIQTADGFCMLRQSLASMLAAKQIFDFPDLSGERLACNKFFDDWFLYAVANDEDYTYSLLKFREQEFDAQEGAPADGDTPGVTISFISFNCEILLSCLTDPDDENRRKLDVEINRVVARKGQRHHDVLKRYFHNPQSWGAYLVADMYVRHIALLADNGCLAVPEHYKKIVQESILHKNARKQTRLPRFIDALNQKAGRIVCDHKNIYIENTQRLTEYEAAAILATHTGNTSVFSFAAEVEYHARFLTPLAKIKIPLFGKSIYDSAIRADMSICDTEFEGSAPYYKENSKIVKIQNSLHKERQHYE